MKKKYAAPQASRYLLEEPASELYFRFTGEAVRLAKKSKASSFATRDSALIRASERLAGQPHELVRVDR